VHSCAVLVVSSDGYRDLWLPFFRLFRQYWPDCPFPVYLGAQTASADVPEVQTLHAGPGESWSGSLRCFLNQLDCENVLLLLEDFFLCDTVSTGKVLDQIAVLRKLEGTVLRLHPNPRPTISLGEWPGIGEQHRLAPFRVSLQASIWNREDLLGLLKDGESAWEFELKGTLRSQEQARGFYCTFQPAFPYRHVVEQGEWFWSAARHYRRLNAGCDFERRRVMKPFTAWRKAVVMKLRQWRGRVLMMPMGLREPDPYARLVPNLGLRVAFLTNLIPPYHKPVLHLLARRYQALRVLLSTPMEANRPWKVDWDDLDVVVQRTYTAKGVWHHPRGFSEPLALHIPLDTLQQLRRFSPDVIISAEMGARTLLAMVFRKLNPYCRLIIWAEAAESTESGRGWARHVARRIFVKNADGFLAVGASAVKYLEGLGAASHRIFKIAYTTDVERFAVNLLTRPAESARRLLFCGQFVERKGLVPFLQVLSRWAGDHPRQSVNFALAGDGPSKQQLSEVPLAANVKLEFLGAFQYDDLPQIYGSAGVFVLPTLADTWAVVVNEALVAGLPVLGSAYAQAVEELIEDGRNGWIFRPDNAEDTYRAIDRMMNTSEAELDAMRVLGRALAAELNPARVADLIGLAVNASVGR
jgi:glycosyltransferase involved in cell wall biosynthesis